MTGTLTTDETSSLLMMTNKKKQDMRLLIPLQNDAYMTLEVDKVRSETKVNVTKEQKVKVKLESKLQVRILEYNLPYPGDYNEMSKKAQEEIENLLVETLQKIQAANCDALSIGREIIAQSLQQFEKLDWNEAYPEAEMNVKAEVELTENGVIL